MQREVEAEALAEKAFACLVNSQFDAARKHLEQAFQLTVLEKSTVSDMLLQVRKREGQQRYQQAKDMELQNRKAEALKAYQELVAAWPDGLVDEKVRVDNLQHDIDNATKEWDAAAAAEQQGDPKTALQHYRNANDFYPDWKDVKARIAKLAQQIQQ
jgi:tetratricopeptide (TPR) repeat protein